MHMLNSLDLWLLVLYIVFRDRETCDAIAQCKSNKFYNGIFLWGCFASGLDRPVKTYV